MNVKPGDLAVMVRAELVANIGLVVYIHPRGLNDGAGWNWLTESSRATPCTRGAPSKFAYVPDAWLRPIRDPGEDATDETLAWFPSPGKVTEAA